MPVRTESRNAVGQAGFTARSQCDGSATYTSIV